MTAVLGCGAAPAALTLEARLSACLHQCTSHSVACSKLVLLAFTSNDTIGLELWIGGLADAAALACQAVRERGITGSELPVRGALAVTVPGAAALWEDTIKAFGKLPLAEVRHIFGVS